MRVTFEGTCSTGFGLYGMRVRFVKPLSEFIQVLDKQWSVFIQTMKGAELNGSAITHRSIQ